MSISIIIPLCSLHKKYLNHCLESIYAQTRKPTNILIILNEYERYKTEYDLMITNNPICTFIKENGY